MPTRIATLKTVAALLAAFNLCCFAPQPVQAERMTVVPSAEANREAYTTTRGIHWYTTLEDAQMEARRTGKMIFWLHMLGTIDGAT